MHRERFYTLTASCPDQVGIIARVSGFIAEHGGWILESSFHADDLTSRYFMRIELKAESVPILLAEFQNASVRPWPNRCRWIGGLPTLP